ncbi:hypothetical protein BDR22DRAFT_910790 [Usnea florida]
MALNKEAFLSYVPFDETGGSCLYSLSILTTVLLQPIDRSSFALYKSTSLLAVATSPLYAPQPREPSAPLCPPRHLSPLIETMKLRSRSITPADPSTPSTAPVPSLPQHIPRLQTPPLSERSNAGSTTVRKDRFEDLSSSSSSSIADLSDTDPARDSTSPPPTTPKPSNIAVPAAPLTKGNLEKFQEEVTSSPAELELPNEHPPPPPPPSSPPPPASPHTRLLQAKHFLELENHTSDPLFATRLKQIDNYLNGLSQEQRERNVRVFRDVRGDRDGKGGVGVGVGGARHGGGGDARGRDGDVPPRKGKAKPSNAYHVRKDGEEARLLCAETPFLQMVMSEQIRADLASGSEDTAANGPTTPSTALLLTSQFALPRPRRELLDEAVG